MTNQDSLSQNDISQDAFIPDDLFERQKIVEKIFKILQSEIEENDNQEHNSNLNSFFPMLVDGNWGTGKTVFCRRLENYINNHCYCSSDNQKHFQTIYIDAFENDHTDNPLFVLLSKIIECLNKQNNTDKIQEITNNAGKVLWSFAKSIAKAGGLGIVEAIVTSLIAELPKEEEFSKNILNESIKNIGSITQQRIEQLFQNDEAKSESIALLKQSLSDYAEENPLVIFVDELDRCKPAFAMDMLEVIKHIFDIPNVKFIIFTFERQLEEAIKHRYGPHIDSQRYLDKFIRFRVQLPSQTYQSGEFVFNTYRYLEEFMKQTPLISEHSQIKPILSDFLRFMISFHNISLRMAEMIIRYCNLYLRLKGRDSMDLDLEILLFYTIILYVINPELCMKIVNRKAAPQEISSFLGLENIISNNTALHGNTASLSTRWVLALMTEFPDFSRMQNIIDLHAKSTSSPWEAILNVAYSIGVGSYLRLFEEGDQNTAKGQFNKIRQLISDIALY